MPKFSTGRSPQESVRLILEALGGNGSDMCHCPAHEDKNPSLSVTAGDRVPLVFCHAGCSQDAVIDALKARGLWPAAGSGSSREGWVLKATWRYFGPNGNRDQEDYETPTGRERRWAGGKDGIKPRRLIAIARGGEDLPGRKYRGIIIFCEGAKTAEAAFKLTGAPAFGFASATTKGKVGPQLPDDDVIEFAGGSCASAWWIIPDNDVQGVAAGAIMARRLAALYPAAKVKWIDPAKLVPHPATGWDVADWVDPPADAIGHFVGACGDPPEPKDTGHAAANRPPEIKTTAVVISGTSPVFGDLETVITAAPVAMCESDNALAGAIADRAGGCLRYVDQEKTWWKFQPGHGWQEVAGKRMLSAVAGFTEHNFYGRNKDRDLVPRPATGGRRGTAVGTLDILAGKPGVLSHVNEWDTERTVLGVGGGRCYDVLADTFRPITVDTLIRKAGVAPVSQEVYDAGPHPRIVEQLIRSDEVAEFTRRRMGQAYVNDPKGGDDLIALFGETRCGKGTLFRGIKGAFGDYAVGVPASQLLAGRREDHPAWRANTAGARLLTCDEMPVGNLDPDQIKSLLGTEQHARHMRGKPFTFTLHAPLLTTANHPPALKAPDGAVDSRLKPIQCGPRPTHLDPGLREWMEGPEGAAHTARWLANGARAAEAGGAPVPVEVAQEIAEVRANTPMTEFVGTLTPGARFTLTGLYERYVHFAHSAQERPIGKYRLRDVLLEEYRFDSGKSGWAYLARPLCPQEKAMDTGMKSDFGQSGHTPELTDHTRGRAPTRDLINQRPPTLPTLPKPMPVPTPPRDHDALPSYDDLPAAVSDLERFTTMDGRNLDLQAFKRAHPSPLQLVSIDALIRWLIEHDDMSRETAHAVVGDRLLAAFNTPQRES